MRVIKDELNKRNKLIFYAKNFSLHDNEQFTSNLKKTIDAVITKGVLVINKIDGMYWGDVDFILELTTYIYESHQLVNNLEQQTDIEVIGDLVYDLRNQTAILLKLIEEHTTKIDDLEIIRICRCDLCLNPVHSN